jgi:DNA modification methylase
MDCMDGMKTLPSDSINLWITSPPYAKQRDYNGFEAGEYSDFLLPIMMEAKRTMKETGSLVVNIKEHCEDGARSLYVYKWVIDMVEKLGFTLVDEFIWNKTNPFPTGAKSRLKDGFERIYHFTKSKGHKFFPDEVLVKSESKWLDSEKRRKNKGSHDVNNGSGMGMSKRISSDMVRPSNVITGTSSNENIDHPAVFPSYLPDFFINLMTERGDSVGDMFSGSGTTAISALTSGRTFTGFELDEDYYKAACERIERETAQQTFL